MLILVEGVDGSGKSVLCNALEAHGYCVYRPVRYSDKQEKVLYTDMWLSDVKFVCDRSFITDIIYRSVFKGQHGPISFREAINYLDQTFRKNSCKIIICRTDTAYEDAMRRGEDNIVDKNISDGISAAYDFFAHMCEEWLNTPITYYDWHRDNVTRIIEFIEGGKT